MKVTNLFFSSSFLWKWKLRFLMFHPANSTSPLLARKMNCKYKTVIRKPWEKLVWIACQSVIFYKSIHIQPLKLAVQQKRVQIQATTTVWEIMSKTGTCELHHCQSGICVYTCMYSFIAAKTWLKKKHSSMSWQKYYL